MKKLLLVAATTSAFLASSFAFAEEAFYMQVDASALFMEKVKIKELDTKLKSKVSSEISLGAGYYVMENARVDLTLNFLVNPEFKRNLSSNVANLKSKGKVMSLMLNGYVDLFDFGVVKLYAGGGIGWAQVKTKLNDTLKVRLNAPTKQTKKSNNFAYQLTLGTSAQITDGITGLLSYKWSDFGKAKYIKNSDNKIHYKGHNIVAGIRFDI